MVKVDASRRSPSFRTTQPRAAETATKAINPKKAGQIRKIRLKKKRLSRMDPYFRSSRIRRYVIRNPEMTKKVFTPMWALGKTRRYQSRVIGYPWVPTRCPAMTTEMHNALNPSRHGNRSDELVFRSLIEKQLLVLDRQ